MGSGLLPALQVTAEAELKVTPPAAAVLLRRREVRTGRSKLLMKYIVEVV